MFRGRPRMIMPIFSRSTICAMRATGSATVFKCSVSSGCASMPSSSEIARPMRASPWSMPSARFIKLETRNSKLETNEERKFSNVEKQVVCSLEVFCPSSFPHLKFVSNFELRVSNFSLQPRRHLRHEILDPLRFVPVADQQRIGGLDDDEVLDAQQRNEIFSRRINEGLPPIDRRQRCAGDGARRVRREGPRDRRPAPHVVPIQARLG